MWSLLYRIQWMSLSMTPSSKVFSVPLGPHSALLSAGFSDSDHGGPLFSVKIQPLNQFFISPPTEQHLFILWNHFKKPLLPSHSSLFFLCSSVTVKLTPLPSWSSFSPAAYISKRAYRSGLTVCSSINNTSRGQSKSVCHCHPKDSLSVSISTTISALVNANKQNGDFEASYG